MAIFYLFFLGVKMKTETLLILFASKSRFQRAKTIYNLLIGRRTVSNLFGALNYGLLDYFDCFHGFKLNSVEEASKKLSKVGLVDTNEKFEIRLTARGLQKQKEIKKFVGEIAAFKTASRFDLITFSHRLILAFQVVSEFSYSNQRYYPKSTSLFDETFIKAWFRNFKGQVDLPKIFSDFLKNFLAGLHNDKKAMIFVNSLYGHEFSGKTISQDAEDLKIKPAMVSLSLFQAYCRIFQAAFNSTDDCLVALTKGMTKPKISASSKATFELFQNQNMNSFQQLASVRRIKLTTVKEHLLEAAIVFPKHEFPYKRLLTKSLIQQLQAAFQTADPTTEKFSEVKRKIPSLDFFYFRLFQIQYLKGIS